MNTNQTENKNQSKMKRDLSELCRAIGDSYYILNGELYCEGYPLTGRYLKDEVTNSERQIIDLLFKIQKASAQGKE